MGFFSTNDLRSQIPTFLGVRSTNPLPEASGLEKLTRPGADFLLDLQRTLLISRGLMGALLKCVKSALFGEVGRWGNQLSCV